MLKNYLAILVSLIVGFLLMLVVVVGFLVMSGFGRTKPTLIENFFGILALIMVPAVSSGVNWFISHDWKIALTTFVILAYLFFTIFGFSLFPK